MLEKIALNVIFSSMVPFRHTRMLSYRRVKRSWCKTVELTGDDVSHSRMRRGLALPMALAFFYGESVKDSLDPASH
jgi:hypothetical protein